MQRRFASRIGTASLRLRGYALVIVLWVLAGLTVVAVSVASNVRSQALGISQLRARIEAERAFLGTASRIKVIGHQAQRLSAELHGARGKLHLDGRLTLVPNATDQVVLQDAAGLIALRADARGLPGLLSACGAPLEIHAALQDALGDFVDADRLKRLNGAEAFEYAAAGRAAPRNAALLSRDEVWRVLGWDAIRAAWGAAACDRWVSVRAVGALNQSTAPLEVLQMLGMGSEQAAALINARESALGISDGPAAELGTANLASVLASGRRGVSPVMRVTHLMPSLEWALQYELEFTGSKPGGPWQVHELRVVPARVPDRAPKASLPPTDYQPSEQERVRLNALSASPFAR